MMSSRPFTARLIAGSAAGVCALTLGTGSAVARGSAIHGTVVHHNARAESFVIAAPSGRLYAIHSRHVPALGSRVALTARSLHDGTFVLNSERVLSPGVRGRRVRAHGTVSQVDRQDGTYTLSSPGVSLVVHPARHRAHQASDGTSSLPTVGSVVTTSGTVDDAGDLDAATTQVDGQDTNGFDLEGSVLSVDPSAGTVTVSSDDDDNASGPITVNVPAPLSVNDFSPGEEVELLVSYANGSYTLLGSSDDQGEQAANDAGDCQGDAPGAAQGDDGGDHGTSTGSTSSGPTSSGSTSSGSGDWASEND